MATDIATDLLKREHDFNFGWKFALEDDQDAKRPEFDDSAWRDVRLPHDWSVEFPFDKEKGEGATGYLPGGIGWYRKHYSVSEFAPGTQFFLLFDGVYNNAEFWLNGQKLGEHPYGYSPFYFDITGQVLDNNQDNVLAVRVDRSRYVDSRWYPGSGIYRHVKLITLPPLHIPIWGTRITTPTVSGDQASVEIQVKVCNKLSEPSDFELVTTLVSPDGHVVASRRCRNRLAPGDSVELEQAFEISRPNLWSPDTPAVYQAVTSLVWNGETVDRYVTPFGIRSFRFDPETGFYLNGVNTLIKGVCLHHDCGLVGAAVPTGVWERRLKQLKRLGCNAIRTAHNPPSSEFLDLCDRMGFLVQDEFFDEWDNPKDKRKNRNEQSVDYVTRGYAEHFQQWAERDLKNTMLRDRNHPCIFMWSIGNEIEWTYTEYEQATGYWDATDDDEYQPNYFWDTPPRTPQQIAEAFNKIPVKGPKLADTARKLADWTREIDTTRPVTANLILPEVSHISGYTDALDVIGYSYRQILYEYCHRLYPEKMLYGAENFAQWHEWKSVLDYPFIPGIFLWTGADYMGEVDGKWPMKGTRSGTLDFASFIKPSGHMMKTLWNDEPHIHLTTNTVEASPYEYDSDSGRLQSKDPDAWKKAIWFWHEVNHHWNYQPGEMIAVEVYTNCESVELFLNEKCLGIYHLADYEDRIIKAAVPFEPGSLIAHAVSRGRSVRSELITAESPHGVVMELDRHSITADGYDVVHVTAQLVDRLGNPVLHEERTIRFDVMGKGVRVLGVDNGASDNVQPYQSDTIRTHEGRCLMILQAETQPGLVTIKAQSENLRGAESTLRLVDRHEVTARDVALSG